MKIVGTFLVFGGVLALLLTVLVAIDAASVSFSNLAEGVITVGLAIAGSGAVLGGTLLRHWS